MHAVFTGTATASPNSGGGVARCRVVVFEKPEVIDKTG